MSAERFFGITSGLDVGSGRKVMIMDSVVEGSRVGGSRSPGRFFLSRCRSLSM